MRREDALLSIRLAASVDAERCYRVVLDVRLRAVAVEDEVGGERDEGKTGRRARRCDRGCSVCVLAAASSYVGLGIVDADVAGRVHDGPWPDLVQRALYAARVRGVELAAARYAVRQAAQPAEAGEGAAQGAGRARHEERRRPAGGTGRRRDTTDGRMLDADGSAPPTRAREEIVLRSAVLCERCSQPGQRRRARRRAAR